MFARGSPHLRADGNQAVSQTRRRLTRSGAPRSRSPHSVPDDKPSRGVTMALPGTTWMCSPHLRADGVSQTRRRLTLPGNPGGCSPHSVPMALGV
jgi:hypothetical protein